MVKYKKKSNNAKSSQHTVRRLKRKFLANRNRAPSPNTQQKIDARVGKKHWYRCPACRYGPCVWDSIMEHCSSCPTCTYGPCELASLQCECCKYEQGKSFSGFFRSLTDELSSWNFNELLVNVIQKRGGMISIGDLVDVIGNSSLGSLLEHLTTHRAVYFVYKAATNMESWTVSLHTNFEAALQQISCNSSKSCRENVCKESSVCKEVCQVVSSPRKFLDARLVRPSQLISGGPLPHPRSQGAGLVSEMVRIASESELGCSQPPRKNSNQEEECLEDIEITGMSLPPLPTEELMRLFLTHVSGVKIEEEENKLISISSAQKQRIVELAREFTSFDPAVNARAAVDRKDHLQECDINHLHLTHDSVAHAFKNGRHRGQSVEGLVEELCCGSTHPSSLPPLVVVRHMGKLWAMTGNRRLYALKRFVERTRKQAKVLCIVYNFDAAEAVPPAIVAKFIHASTTKSQGMTATLRRQRWAPWRK